MTRFWTCHWQFRFWRPEINSEGQAVTASGSNSFRKRGVSVGDSVYIISLSAGHLYLGGRMTVKQIVSRPEAVKLWNNDNLYYAREWIVDPAESGTPLHLHRRLSPALTRQLRFVSGVVQKEPCFVSDTELDNQATRGVREISLESAALLDRIVTFTDGLPKSDGIITVTEELLTDVDSAERQVWTEDDYAAALRRVAVAPHHMRMLQAHYHAPDRTLTATQMSKALGYPSYAAANLHYGKLGRLVGEQIGWRPPPKQTVFVLVTFQKPKSEWQWIMRPALAGALEQLDWVEGDHPTIPEEVHVTAPHYEGAVRKITVNAYERNSAAREMCILHHGCRCAACGLTLSEKYGEDAQGLIHVHHLRQLADVNAEYQVDPIQDLRPVCPTCHAVIHNQSPPFTIEEIRALIEKQDKNANNALHPA